MGLIPSQLSPCSLKWCQLQQRRTSPTGCPFTRQLPRVPWRACRQATSLRTRMKGGCLKCSWHSFRNSWWPPWLITRVCVSGWWWSVYLCQGMSEWRVWSLCEWLVVECLFVSGNEWMESLKSVWVAGGGVFICVREWVNGEFEVCVSGWWWSVYLCQGMSEWRVWSLCEWLVVECLFVSGNEWMESLKSAWVAGGGVFICVREWVNGEFEVCVSGWWWSVYLCLCQGMSEWRVWSLYEWLVMECLFVFVSGNKWRVWSLREWLVMECLFVFVSGNEWMESLKSVWVAGGGVFINLCLCQGMSEWRVWSLCEWLVVECL